MKKVTTWLISRQWSDWNISIYVNYMSYHAMLLRFHRAPYCSDLMTNSKRLLHRPHPLLDDLLAILPQLPRIFDTKPVIENILDLLQCKTGYLRVEEVCVYMSATALQTTSQEKRRIALTD